MASSGSESHQFSNISATTNSFGLAGGTYAFVVSANWTGGSVQLETLSQDGSTWINVGSSVTANGFSTVQVAAGQYRVAVVTATAVYCSLSTIPD